MTKVNKRTLLSLALIAVFSVSCWAQNVITNGNFESGNTGFQTEYVYSSSLTAAGKYAVNTNASAYNSGNTQFFNLTDHTSGHGKYFIANGYGGNYITPSENVVWMKTVTVQPHSYYDFSFWATHLNNGGAPLGNFRAKFIVKFDGSTVGEEFQPEFHSDQGFWGQFPVYHWYSANKTQVTIAIYDNCSWPADWGDDFGLDDITLDYKYSNVVQCVDDYVTTCYETSINIDPVANDVVTPSNLNVDYTNFELPMHGSLDWVSGTTFVYTPNSAYSGSDSFTYKLTFGTNDIIEYGTVHITVTPRPQRTINQHACESFTWTGYTNQTYTQDGTWQYIKVNPSGCDSLITLNLTIHHATEETLPAMESCDEFTWHGTTYTSSGLYDYETTNQWGCQHVQHLPLTIHHSDTVEMSVSACEEYTWHNETYNTSGDKLFWTTNVHGCDRLEILHLTISDAFREVENITECDEYYWPRTGRTYTQSIIDSVSVAGAQGGCDSTFVLNLTLHYADEVMLDPVSACDSFDWYGVTYEESDLLSHQTVNEWGCERIEHLPLTINHSETVELQPVTVCDELEWHGQVYTQSGTCYFDTINQFGCNLRYVLPLTVHYGDTIDYEHVEACDSYLWNGQTITETGLYTQQSFTPEGCDRLERIYVTVNYSSLDTLVPVTSCDSYEWHDSVYTQSGYHRYETVGPTGCPLVEILPLTIHHSSYNEFFIKSCEPYEWYGTVYSEPGVYTHIIENAQSCDSVLIMHLEMGDIYEEEFSDVGCGEYEWFDNIYYESGRFEHMVENPNGCDSVFVLNLTIAEMFDENIYRESCNSYTWDLDTYTESGVYQHQYPSVMGCDSIVTLHLTINETVYHEFEQKTCLPYVWNGMTYYEPGEYVQTFEAHNGCDSIVTMHLVASDAFTREFYYQACQPIQWNEHFCDHDGDYVHTYHAQQGCDTIITMHFNLVQTTVLETETIFCDSIEWGGAVHYSDFDVYADTVYSQQGCDSIVNLYHFLVHNAQNAYQINGESQVFVATDLISGLYRYYIDSDDVVSFDSWQLSNHNWQIIENNGNECIIYVTSPGSAELTVSFQTMYCGEMTRSMIINAAYFDVNENFAKANVFPNPTSGLMRVEADEIVEIKVLDVMGQVLMVNRYGRENQVELNLTDFAPALYLLEIRTSKGKTVKQVAVSR